jgi:putative hemolysin
MVVLASIRAALGRVPETFVCGTHTVAVVGTGGDLQYTWGQPWLFCGCSRACSRERIPHLVGGIEIGIVLLLIVLNGVFAMSELSVVSSRESRLQQRLDQGKRGAGAALELAADPNRFLSTVQIGITLIGVGTGAFGGATLSGRFAGVLAHIPGLEPYSLQVAALVVVVFITYLSLIIGELVPKRLALQNPEGMACLVAPAMRTLSRLTAPIVSFLAISSDFVFRIIGLKPSEDAIVSDEEIDHLLRQGTEAGIFHPSERVMVSGIFDISDRTAGELMTPRHLIHFIDVAKPEEDGLQRMAASPHNFYPVCDGTPDNVIGVVAIRELWRRHLSGEPVDIRVAMEPPLFVPEIAPVLSVMEQMRHRRSPVAMVIDEYGGVEGLLTLNDVLSDVVGEVDDPERPGFKGAVQRDDGSWLLDGVFPAHEVMELFDLDTLPGEAESRYETIGGFIVEQLRAIPSPGVHVDFGGYRFEVMDMDGNRIDKILVVRES